MRQDLFLLGVALVIPLLPVAARAELTANLGLTSKYKFRGQDQSDATKSALPAVQGGFDFADAGFYAGNWNSSIGSGGGTEMDFYGGFTGEVSGFSYDFGALAYYYPGDTSLNTTEIYLGGGFGPVTAKYSYTVSSKWFGVEGGRGSGYFELNAEFPVGNGFALVGHVGATQFSSDAKANGVVNYADYKVGASYDLGSGFSVEGAYVGATKKSEWEAYAGGKVNKDRFVLALSKSL